MSAGRDVSSLGEFGFLGRVRRWAGSGDAVVGIGSGDAVVGIGSGDAVVGIGDDAAVLPATGDSRLVATTDLLFEGTHFRREWSSASDIGWRAVSVNVSDLAAMGALPRWILVGLAVRQDTAVSFLEQLYEGLGEACRAYGAAIVGGDTVRSDTLVLAVTALGEVDGPVLTRSGARPGDTLAVTGVLGLAATGVNLLLASTSPVPSDPAPDEAACLAAHRRPVARVEAGRALGAGGAHAAMDLSDGLASDAHRIAEESGVRIDIDGDSLPIAPEAARVCAGRGWDATRLALFGGEDFELLVAVDDVPGAPVPLLPVGRVSEGRGVFLTIEGETRPLPEGGWDHFRQSV